jgi:RNA polymerase subunit RPABC4/transcription elongation factor Spt4
MERIARKFMDIADRLPEKDYPVQKPLNNSRSQEVYGDICVRKADFPQALKHYLNALYYINKIKEAGYLDKNLRGVIISDKLIRCLRAANRTSDMDKYKDIKSDFRKRLVEYINQEELDGINAVFQKENVQEFISPDEIEAKTETPESSDIIEDDEISDDETPEDDQEPEEEEPSPEEEEDLLTEDAPGEVFEPPAEEPKTEPAPDDYSDAPRPLVEVPGKVTFTRKPDFEDIEAMLIKLNTLKINTLQEKRLLLMAQEEYKNNNIEYAQKLMNKVKKSLTFQYLDFVNELLKLMEMLYVDGNEREMSVITKGFDDSIRRARSGEFERSWALLGKVLDVIDSRLNTVISNDLMSQEKLINQISTELNANTSLAEENIRMARELFDKKEYRDAVGWIEKCQEESEKALEAYKMFYIESSKMLFSVLNLNGIDTHEFSSLLSEFQEDFENKRFREAEQQMLRIRSKLSVTLRNNDDILKKIVQWKEEGYDLSHFEMYINNADLKTLGVAFNTLEDSIEMLVQYEKELQDLASDDFLENIERIKQNLKDPEKVQIIKEEIENLKEEIEQRTEDLKTKKQLERELEILSLKVDANKIDKMKSELEDLKQIKEVQEAIEKLRTTIEKKKEDKKIVKGYQCPDCGAIIPPNSTKCPYCGLKLLKDELIIKKYKCDIIERKECPDCWAVLDKETDQCPHCGLETFTNCKEIYECPSCGEEIEPETAACFVCGIKFIDSDELETTDGPEPDGETEESADLRKRAIEKLSKINGIGPSKAQALYDAGFTDYETLRNAKVAEITQVKGLNKTNAINIKKQLEDIKD